MAKKTLKDYEKELTPLQVQIANELVANAYCKNNDKKTVTQLAEEVGVSRQTIYTHKNNGAVIAYMALLSERAVNAFQANAESALLKLIDDGTGRLPSVKALQLYFQITGKLVNRTVNADSEGDFEPRISNAEITAELEDLNKLLDGGN
ncbi:putative transcriptional regulator [Peribacillus sp. B2I2]|uniref:phBC6A51 family helix-turn-helix protein n=1 Tax=Peribacillus sp. B2I2 TaxID=3156468 RepID=UPI00351852A7